MPSPAEPAGPDRAAPIAAGRASTVHAKGDVVVRRSHDPAVDLEHEVRVLTYARDAGLPVPAVVDLRGRDLTLERIPGPTMLAAMVGAPARLPELIGLLVDLLEQVHAVAAPRWLPLPFGPGPSLLHLDLHPRNVILGPAGPAIVDWGNAAGGRAAYDVAQTWLILATAGIDDDGGADGRSEVARRMVLRRFVRRIDGPAAAAVLPAVARARLHDRNIPDGERSAVAAVVGELDRGPIPTWLSGSRRGGRGR